MPFLPRRRRAHARPAPFPSVTPADLDSAAHAAGFSLDPAQREATGHLLSPARGHVYLHGPAGRGKSWLMDAAFSAAATDSKVRFHFHEFFRDLHAAIVRRDHDLDAALTDLLGRARLVCFDEFHVHDPGDAVLISRLLTALLEREGSVVVTSNFAPEGLMPNPYFHAMFLPQIEKIRAHFDIVSLDGGRDHREQATGAAGFAAGSWTVPDTDEARRALGVGADAPVEVRVGPRALTARLLDDTTACFDFAELCGSPVSAADMLELSTLRPRWVLRAVPSPELFEREPAQRFANLIDIAYDRDVELHVLAAGSPDGLARASQPPLDVSRTLSRLRELGPGPAADGGDDSLVIHR